MTSPACSLSPAVARLDALRVEFVDLAVALERRGRLDAADIALAASARLAEVRDQLATAAPSLNNVQPKTPD